jgi:hypothetical protein
MLKNIILKSERPDLYHVVEKFKITTNRKNNKIANAPLKIFHPYMYTGKMCRSGTVLEKS